MDKQEEKRRMPYMVRNEVLKSIGYRTYKEYLASEDWKSLRKSILDRFVFCICCDSKAQVVHHLRYDSRTLLGINNANLAPLCHKCHEAIEIENGEKTRMGTANVLLFAMARKKDSQQVWLMEFYKNRVRPDGADRKERIAVANKLKNLDAPASNSV